MITKIEENDGIMTVYLEGRMDTPSSSETDDELAPLYETECKEIANHERNVALLVSDRKVSMLTRTWTGKNPFRWIIVRREY